MPYLDHRNGYVLDYIIYQDAQVVQFWSGVGDEAQISAAEFVSTMTVTAEDGSTTEIPRFDTTGPDVEPIPAEVTARRAFLATYAANNGGHL